MSKKAVILKIAGNKKQAEKKGKMLVEKAYSLAEKTFESKDTKEKKNFEHAERVAEKLFELGFDNTTIAAGLVCKLYSEAEIPPEEMLTELGKEVESIAADYGKIKQIEGKNFGKIDNKILSTIILATARDLRSIFIKFAARLDSLENGNFSKKELAKRAEGALRIYAPICQKMGLYNLQSMLEDSSLKILKPDTYSRISSFLGKTRKTRNKEVEMAIVEFSSYIKERPSVSIEGRAKSIYSIYE
ncbi:MAG: HD domain-containing protein, partial [Candidatus Diapherotrites archaeon]|nr:HD domain-containing protein [Candidatus Diapherotrites archaeon]